MSQTEVSEEHIEDGEGQKGDTGQCDPATEEALAQNTIDDASGADTNSEIALDEAPKDETTSETENESQSETLELSENGEIVWNNVAIARLLPNQQFLSPKFELIGPELNQEETAKIVTQRLDGWLVETIRTDLAPLFRLKRAIEYTAPIVPVVEIISKASDEKNATEAQAQDLKQESLVENEAKENSFDKDVIEESTIDENSAEIKDASENSNADNSKDEIVTEEKGAKQPAKPSKPVRQPPKEFTAAAKEIAQLVFDNCGILERSQVETKISALSQDNRRELRAAGIKFGRNAIYLPLLLKPKSARLNVILSKLSKGEIGTGPILLPPIGVTSFEAQEGFDEKDYLLCGFQKLGTRAIRLDIIDRVIDTLFEAAKDAKTGFEMPIAVVSLLGVSNEAAQNIVSALGWSCEEAEDGVKKWRFRRPAINYKRPQNYRGPKPDGTKDESARSDSAKKPQGRGKDMRGPRPQNQGFKKKHSDKGEKMRTPRDYSARPSRNIEDSPFAILASLKAELQNKKE